MGRLGNGLKGFIKFVFEFVLMKTHALTLSLKKKIPMDHTWYIDFAVVESHRSGHQFRFAENAA